MLKIIRSQPARAFTLAELLIALTILGVIATFAIPKVLQAQHDRKLNAIAKESMATLTSALFALRYDGKLSATVGSSELTPYLNYVKVETGGAPGCSVDSLGGSPTIVACSAYAGTGAHVLRLHNGALFIFNDGIHFGGTASTNGIPFTLDPDGKGTGRGDSLSLFLYYNGRVGTWKECPAATRYRYNNANYAPCSTQPPPPQADYPPWFSWD